MVSGFSVDYNGGVYYFKFTTWLSYILFVVAVVWILPLHRVILQIDLVCEKEYQERDRGLEKPHVKEGN